MDPQQIEAMIQKLGLTPQQADAIRQGDFSQPLSQVGQPNVGIPNGPEGTGPGYPAPAMGQVPPPPSLPPMGPPPGGPPQGPPQGAPMAPQAGSDIDPSIYADMNDEQLQQMAGMGDLDRQLAMAEKMRDADPLKGRYVNQGRTYVADSPIAHAVRGYGVRKGRKDAERIGGEQTAGRKTFIDLLRNRGRGGDRFQEL